MQGFELALLQLRRLNCLQRSILVQKRGPEEKRKKVTPAAMARQHHWALLRVEWTGPS